MVDRYLPPNLALIHVYSLTESEIMLSRHGRTDDNGCPRRDSTCSSAVRTVPQSRAKNYQMRALWEAPTGTGRKTWLPSRFTTFLHRTRSDLNWLSEAVQSYLVKSESVKKKLERRLEESVFPTTTGTCDKCRSSVLKMSPMVRKTKRNG